MKRIITLVLAIVMMFLLASCSVFPFGSKDNNSGEKSNDTNTANSSNETIVNSSDTTVSKGTIKIPDLSDVDETSAKTSLANKGLLPVVEHEYSDTIAKGNVIRTEPTIGSEVAPDSKVTIYVSSGPKTVNSKGSTISWYHIDPNNPDDWNLYGLGIMEGKLYILCETTFGTSFVLQGNGFGNASLTDTFDKIVPITILDKDLNELQSDMEINAGEPFMFTIEIPLAQLDSERPTHIACKIVIRINDKQEKIDVSFNATW